jgi:hypothetical protein
MSPAAAEAGKNIRNVVGGKAMLPVYEKEYEDIQKRVSRIKEYL